MNHIKFEDGIAWCSAPLDNSFHFKDIEQVTINNLHGERLVCQYCLRSVITGLLRIPPPLLTTSAQNGILED